MSGLRVIFAGSGEFGLPTLRALLESAAHRVVGVVSQPDRPAGRGRHSRPTPIAQFALERQLPLQRTSDINTEPLLDADVLLVIAFGQKVAEHVVNRPRLGSINLHASRLPRYRGAAPINWAILDGQTTTGNSVIRLASRMDAGDILAQSLVPIGPLQTAGELHDGLADDGVALVLGVLDGLDAGTCTQTPQDDAQATLAPKLSRDAARLEFNQNAQSLAWRIRGLYPWPGCRVQLLDAAGQPKGRLTLVTARPNGTEGTRWRPGEIMANGCVATGPDSALEIVRVQPEGGRDMTLREYRNGHPWQPGLRLDSIS